MLAMCKHTVQMLGSIVAQKADVFALLAPAFIVVAEGMGQRKSVANFAKISCGMFKRKSQELVKS